MKLMREKPPFRLKSAVQRFHPILFHPYQKLKKTVE